MSDPNKPNMPNLLENRGTNFIAATGQQQASEITKKKTKKTGQPKLSQQNAKVIQVVTTSNQPAASVKMSDNGDKKLPNERWQEILRYETNFFVDIEIFLKLEPYLLKQLPSSCHAQWSDLFNAYRSFDKSKSLLFQVSRQPEHRMLTEDNYLALIKLLVDSICKERNYWDRIVNECSKNIQKQQAYGQVASKYKNNLSHLNLNEILPAEVCVRLIEEYPEIVNSNYLNKKLIDFLDKIIALPMQYVTKMPLLFADLKNDTKNYPEVTKRLTNIQQRISSAVESANSMQLAREYGTEARFSTVVAEKQAPTLQHLSISIAYIFQIVAYYMQHEANKNTEIESYLLGLLNDTRHIFINVGRTPGAIGTLIEKLQRIPDTNLAYEMRELIKHCVALLEGDLKAINRINVILSGKLKDAKELTTAKEADLYNYHSIINWVIREVESIITGINTEKTLAPVKTATQFFSRILSSEQDSGLILLGLRLKSFKIKLEGLLTVNYEQLNNFINSLQQPFQKNIANLMAYLFAGCSQFCNRKVPYMSIEAIEPLMTLLKMTQSFQKDTQQAITDAYLKINSFENKLRTVNEEHPPKKSNILFLINILFVLNEHYKADNDKAESDVLLVKKMVIKFCFQLKRDPQVQLPLNELKLAIQSLKTHIPSNNTWLMETLNNLVDGRLTFVAGAPLGLIVHNISRQDELLYLYKCIIQQCSNFLVNYMNSVSGGGFIKQRTTATAKQRYADYCSEQLNDELYHAGLKQIKQQIGQVVEPYSKSIIGLLETKFASWEATFDSRRLNSITTKGELLKAIEDLHAFFDELKPIISPKPNELEFGAPQELQQILKC